MPKTNVLPGVDPARVPPAVLCDSRRVIVRARRFALARDLAQLALLAGVDVLMIQWPLVHVPLMTRVTSITLAVALNLIVGAHVALCRLFPRWSAKRIANTWCFVERQRLARILRRR